MPRPTVRIATAHLSPTFLSPSATLQTILQTIRHAAANHATLIAFPESFLPGFPFWSALLPPSHAATHAFFAAFADASVYADGPEIDAVRHAAREYGISVSLGFSEKARYSSGTLWNSNVIIEGGTGEVKVHHRKLQPTFYERLSWGMGDGKGLDTAAVPVKPLPGSCGSGVEGATAKTDTNINGDSGAPHSTKHTPASSSSSTTTAAAPPPPTEPQAPTTIKIGTLICGENTNPLARYALIAQGEDIHISSWPAVWPTRLQSPPPPPSTSTSTSSSSPSTKNYDNVLANRLRAAAHCFEAKCFGIMSAASLSEENIAFLLSFLSAHSSATDPFDAELYRTFEATLRATSRAASMVLDPTGAPVVGWTVAVDGGEGEKGKMVEREMLREEEGVLFADLDLGVGVEGKQYHDIVGGYQRGDVFALSVDRTRREVVRFGGLE